VESSLEEASLNQFLFPITSEHKSLDLSRLFFVDPAGFEPASKQGIKRVSTCLVI